MPNITSLRQLKTLAFPLLAFSSVTNLTILVSPIFMMQVLDRVVPSGNLSTLALLLVVAALAIATQAVVEMCRDTALQRSARWVETCGTTHALTHQGQDRQSIIDNTVTLTQFLNGPAAVSALNIPWLPLFAVALLLIHPLFLLLVGAIIGVLFGAKSLSGFLTQDRLAQAQSLAKEEHRILADASDHVVVSGMRAISENLAARYGATQIKRHAVVDGTTTATTASSAVTAAIRLFAQIAALSVGAYLVIQGVLTSGGMIGASIIVSKTIGTLESSLNTWPDITAARAAFTALKSGSSTQTPQTDIPSFSGQLTATGLIFPRGGGAIPRLDRISLTLDAGECLAIVGDSGSGKTTLLNALCAVDPCPIGTAFFDESDVRTLSPDTTRHAIGYLPQQARILKGTVAENISCFSPTPDDKKIIAAARIAGVHGLISALPQAYDTDLGTQGYLLSAGQKQRVALARAVYEKPKYLFLDEPNALLDAAGERQLCDTLALLKKQGTTIVMVLHRSGIMGLADKVAVLDNGRLSDFGPRSEVLGRMNDGKQRLQLPLNSASVQDLNDWIVAQFMRHSDAEFCQKSVIVATEMFNAACQNGAQDMRRDCTIIFRFVDENHAEIMLTEDAQTQAAEKMTKIRSLVQHPEVNMIDLEPDEIALAVVSQMTDTLEVKNIEQASLFAASFSSDKSRQKARIAH